MDTNQWLKQMVPNELWSIDWPSNLGPNSTCMVEHDYRQVSNISRTLVGNKIIDHSDVVGASPVGAAPTTSSFST